MNPTPEPKTPLPPPVAWRVSRGQTAYPEAVAAMEGCVGDIIARRETGGGGEQVWLVEHPPLYTAGTSAQAGDVLAGASLPVFESGRGGQHTYHGPGQRVAYVMVDLHHHKRDVRAFVHDLESWMIATLAQFGITGERREGRVGIWVARGDGSNLDDKIGAIGVRVRKWVSFHGLSLNVAPDLSHYDGIVPCGIAGHGVTSLAKLGIDATIEDVDRALRDTFEKTFSRTLVDEP